MTAGGAGPTAGGAADLDARPGAVSGERDRTDARRGLRLRTVLLVAVVGFLLLDLVRAATGTADLTSSGTMGAALRLSVPIGLAALGGLWSERAGVVNIGLEGMMILGTWFGAWAGYEHGPWVGVLAGLLGGAVGGLVHAVATVGFGVDHIVSGVAINILALGVGRFLSSSVYRNTPGGGPTQSPSISHGIGVVTLPFLSGGTFFGWHGPDPLGRVEAHHWFFVSDLAGVLGGLTRNVSLFTLIAVALVPVSFLLLWRTSLGLRLRSVGEAPLAAESLGVGVYRMKAAAVVVSGAFAGLAGAFLVTVASDHYQESQTGGRGFIGLAAMIFGNWRPTGLALGSGLFGYSDALQLRDPAAVHALLLFVGLALVLVALRAAVRRTVRAAAVSAAAAVALLLCFALSKHVSAYFIGATPYVVTLLVLTLSAQRLRPPAADGQPYRRGQQT